MGKRENNHFSFSTLSHGVKALQYKVQSALLLLIILILAAQGFLLAEPIKLVIAGRNTHFAIQPIREESSVYVPLAALIAIGARGSLVGEPQDGRQEIEITSASGRNFTCKAKIFNGSPMIQIQDIAEELGAITFWDEKSKSLSIRARIECVEFDGSRLVVNTSYPVTYKALRWASEKKLILDISGVHMPSNIEHLTRNSTSVSIRTGTREDGETGRIVLDLPHAFQHKTLSAPKSMKIVISVTPPVATLKTEGDSNVIPAGRVATLGGEQENNNFKQNQADGKVEVEITPSPPVMKSDASVGTTKVAVKPLPPPAEIISIICHNRSPKSIELEVRASKQIQYETSLLRHPDRVYLDIKNAVLACNFDGWAEEHQLVRSVQAGQQNGNLVRISLELTRVAAPEVRLDKASNRLLMKLEPPKSSGGTLASKVIVVDPGHGGPGQAGRGALGCNGSLEKTINLEIAKRVHHLLKSEGACSLLTRDDNDTFLEVSARPEFARRHSADIFISIHNNSCGKMNSVSGTETYFHKWDPDSRALATCIHTEVVAVTGLPDRKVKSDLWLYQNGLGVLRGATAYGIPAALIEVAYMNHAGDEKLLNDPDFQQRVAEAIVRGLKVYVEGSTQGSQTAKRTGTGNRGG